MMVIFGLFCNDDDTWYREMSDTFFVHDLVDKHKHLTFGERGYLSQLHFLDFYISIKIHKCVLDKELGHGVFFWRARGGEKKEMSSLDDIFKKNFKRSLDDVLPKKNKGEGPPKHSKKLKTVNLFIPISVLRKELADGDDTSDEYFVSDTRHNRKILIDFRDALAIYDTSDFIKFQDDLQELTTETFNSNQLKTIHRVFNLRPDLHSHFEVREGKLSGKLNKQIKNLCNTRAEGLDVGDAVTWIMEKLGNRSFFEEL